MAFDLAAALKNVPNLGTTGKEQITYLPLDSLDSDEGNFYEIRGVDQLADNISVAGLQQPIRVRAGNTLGRYTIVSGHRRVAALRLLASAEPEAWEKVPCIVETDAVSPALQQLRLIYANANTRQLTSAELSEQAAQVEQLLYVLKEEGYEFPGRMRDHVAEAVGASRSKLARLKVIRDRLIPEFAEAWKAGTLSEDAAYSLAQAPADKQQLIHKYSDTADGITKNQVANVLVQMGVVQETCDTLHCFRGCTCDHGQVRQAKAVRCGAYDRIDCRGCCRDCYSLTFCRQSCEYAADVKNAKIAEQEENQKIRAAQQKQAAAEQKDRDKAEKDLLNAFYGRVAQRQEALGLTAQEVLASWNVYITERDLKHYDALIHGKAQLVDRLPGGIWANEARKLMAAADFLQCSVDYLLGRDVTKEGGNNG